MRWQPGDITFDIDPEGTEYPVVTVKFGTPAGDIEVMADVSEDGRTLRLRGLHIQGAAANAVGIVNLRVLADVAMSEYGCDAIEIEGAVRTTGARPGHQPRRLRFTRRPDPAAGI
jgi:hypothetical protein